MTITQRNIVLVHPECPSSFLPGTSQCMVVAGVWVTEYLTKKYTIIAAENSSSPSIIFQNIFKEKETLTVVEWLYIKIKGNPIRVIRVCFIIYILLEYFVIKQGIKLVIFWGILGQC